MRHKITDDVLRLIRQAIDDNRGSKANFCRDSGIKPYDLSKILSGEKNVVLDEIWWKLCDYFPEIDDRSLKIKGHCNAVNGSRVVVGNNNNFGGESIEAFRSELISEIILLDIDPVAKDIVLKTITAFKRRTK